MFRDKAQNIIDVLNSFHSDSGEPQTDVERYILKAMWVMAVSEFEASLKDKIENYIIHLRSKPINCINICILIRNFFGDKDEKLTPEKVINLYTKDPLDINFHFFTRDRKARNKQVSVEKLFSYLGIFFDDNEKDRLRLLDGISSTRDSIAHGDSGVSVTCAELRGNIDTLSSLYTFLVGKLDFS